MKAIGYQDLAHKIKNYKVSVSQNCVLTMVADSLSSENFGRVGESAGRCAEEAHPTGKK